MTTLRSSGRLKGRVVYKRVQFVVGDFREVGEEAAQVAGHGAQQRGARQQEAEQFHAGVQH